MDWFTKRKMVVGSLIMILVYIISYFNEALNLPFSYDNFCCVDDRRFNLFAIFIPIFVFTLIFTNINEIKFIKWKKFTFIYLSVYLFIYFNVPTQGDGFIWFQRETISFFGFIIYSIISLFLIIYKSLKKE